MIDFILGVVLLDFLVVLAVEGAGSVSDRRRSQMKAANKVETNENHNN